ncbi:hypothetical protein OG982_29925 [Streptomyces sp. NBC_01551]|uniref:hypothetical protein n=1 Tax=Streptomyces sp. NBC_01551 TaxID=2975876 RepID=UPI0022515E62|nr:hypothetical protein [Streptomyces sp. NBC_01551]MCX4529863.1 hypothetical protein [Streptomyces sp. NBC_01551]
MNGLMVLLKRTWIDWAVFVCMVVTASRCKSPFLVVFFTVVALVAAVVGVRKTWQVARPAGSET